MLLERARDGALSLDPPLLAMGHDLDALSPSDHGEGSSRPVFTVVSALGGVLSLGHCVFLGSMPGSIAGYSIRVDRFMTIHDAFPFRLPVHR
jgi:hypothetical protein